MTRILLVDDHGIVRQGLRHVLGRALGSIAFGEAATSREALELLSGSAWDLVLADISMPGRDGLELLEDIQRMYPRLPVLIVSGFPEEEIAVRALRLGAAGYVAKNTAPEELAAAVTQVLRGRKYVTAAVAQRLAHAVGVELPPRPHEILSTRELQVVRLVAQGHSGKAIADQLKLSEKTIETYRARIAEKLGIHSKVELTRFAIAHKLID